MNILPHKSWHVRTKTNIARVRKDQAKAAEEEAEKQRRVAVADYEARINLLRKRTNQAPETETSESGTKNEVDVIPTSSSSGHVDLFADHEDKQKKVKPMDEEKRLEQEKYEKQIGYLTYLGQDTHEALGTQSWYNAPRQRQPQNESIENGEKVEIGLKTKHLNDPMFQFLKKSFAVEPKKVCEKKELPNVQPSTDSNLHGISIGLDEPRKRKRSVSQESKHKKSKSHKRSKDKKEKKKKHKKEKHKRKHSSSSSGSKGEDNESEQLKQQKLQTLQKLREERLQRERQEQNRTKDFLRNKFPALLPPEEVKKPEESNTGPRVPLMKRKYNSQFNPFLAKQNYSN